MAVIQVSSGPDGPMPFTTSERLSHTLQRGLAPTRGPVTVMIHGYRYGPGAGGDCPHRALFDPTGTLAPVRGQSWARKLGLDAPDRLGIGFGWNGLSTLPQAFVQAGQAGANLARLVRLIRQLAPDRQIQLIGHSMGARVALAALPALGPEDVGRIVLLTGAEFTQTARAALTSPAGRSATVLNVTSRENDLFDFLTECLLPAPARGDRVIGAGLAAPNVIDLQLDHRDALHALRRLGFAIPAEPKRICHWSTYLRDGVFPLYRAFLDDDLPAALLRAALPDSHDPRWSRLLPHLPAPPALPFRPKPT
ncbi:alpha/beta fold hydrolase [Mesobacterium sp. TK19101]|uniref:Alpha/beta fold hydrolase n=1 Tax=Mesobacterium hydrothermale TaxID=3111907 RepID=A0ABU6HHU5_9RHOB|nr:alpha/beta fold hydrolase [Mesobacterium sp. TK19101]MEC3861967.1 alpha/beta fold hydrolase [Mesobacterium sp. TK19101]